MISWKAPAGSALHGVGDRGVLRRVIAETIAGKLGVETKSISDEEAPHYLGFLAPFTGLDNPTSNDKTRQLLGWEPAHAGWVEERRRATTSREPASTIQTPPDLIDGGKDGYS